MHIQTAAHRAAALLAEWDKMMAEVYEYVAMDRERRPEQVVFRFVRGSDADKT